MNEIRAISGNAWADDTIRDVEGFVTAIDLKDQQVLYCTYIDMTERNHVRALLEEANVMLEERVMERTRALEEERNLLRTVIDAVPDFIYVKDTQHRMILNNIAHARSVGVDSPQVVVGKTDKELFPPEMAEKFWADEERLFQTQTPILQTEERSLGVDGNEIWAITTKIPLHNLDGELIGLVGITHDVTPIKEKEEALRKNEKHLQESQNMLKMVLDTIPVRVFWKNIHSMYLGCNYLCASDLGLLTTDDIIGKYDSDLPWLAQQASMLRHDDLEVIRTGTPKLNYEEEIISPEGQSMFVQTSKLPMHNSEAKIIGVLGVYIDITERKQTEVELMNLSQRLQLATEASGIGIWDYDVENDTMHWDEQMFKLYGVDAEQFAPSIQGWQNTLHPDDIVRAQAEAESADKDRKEYNSEFRIITPAGATRYLHAIANLYWDAEGRHRRSIGVNIDVTEQKLAQIALRDSEERYRSFIESAPIAVIVSDDSGKIVLFNQTTQNLFGYEADELMGALMDILVPDDVRVGHASMMREFVAKGQQRLHAIELSARHKEGYIIPVDIQLSIVQTSSETFSVAFVIDITQRKEAEQVLQMALEKEKELGELKSRFVFIASHQFRTPLAAILANTDTLGIYRDRMESSQIDMRLNRIRKQVNHMKTMVDDVLQLARMQANQLQYQPTEADLDALCREIIEDFAHQETYRDRIVYEAPQQTLMTHFDPHLMHHVISNLIHNALKYSADDQSVYIRLSQSADESVLSVKDEGIGIPADNLKHIFDPFYRADNIGAISGTGLGLSITKQAIDAHEGTIHIDSTLGMGTTFTIKLPQHKDGIDDENNRD